MGPQSLTEIYFSLPLIGVESADANSFKHIVISAVASIYRDLRHTLTRGHVKVSQRVLSLLCPARRARWLFLLRHGRQRLLLCMLRRASVFSMGVRRQTRVPVDRLAMNSPFGLFLVLLRGW